MKIGFSINDREWTGEVAARMTLADLLRDRLRLTGTHLGCEQGVCGACTILIEGEAVRSCLMLAVQADGLELRTVEGFGREGHLSALQDAFLKHRAFQCGFCTPGFLASAEELLASGRRYTREELTELLSGNLCRCTGYQSILDAILECQG